MTPDTASNDRAASNQTSAIVVDAMASQNGAVDEQGERHSEAASGRGRSRESSRNRTYLVNRTNSWNPAPGARGGVVLEDLYLDRRRIPSRSRSRPRSRVRSRNSWRGLRSPSMSPSDSGRRKSRTPPRTTPVQPPRLAPVPITIIGPNNGNRCTTNTITQLDNGLGEFSSLLIIATILALVSVAVLSLGRDLCEDASALSSLNHTLYVILRVFGCLALAFHLSVAIVAGNAASSQSLLGQRARDFISSQHLDIKLSLCAVLRYYGLLSLTISAACLFGLLLESPYAILMIIPVAGVVFYDALTHARVLVVRPYEP